MAFFVTPDTKKCIFETPIPEMSFPRPSCQKLHNQDPLTKNRIFKPLLSENGIFKPHIQLFLLTFSKKAKMFPPHKK